MDNQETNKKEIGATPGTVPNQQDTTTEQQSENVQISADGNVLLETPAENQPSLNQGDLMPDGKRVVKIACYNCKQKLDVTYMETFSHITCPSCGADLIVPKWFDNYLLEEPGGIGGMATVYRALDLALDREVAIKVLNQELASGSDRSNLFLHEARTAATINHYAVVPIYTCGIFEGQTYIIMQYMGGGSLETKLKLSKGVLPVRDVIQWIHDIAEGLDNARLHGIVHHDVKPGNILLDNENNAKIGDFGIAQIVNGTGTPSVEEYIQTWVSPYYVSPEKLRNGKEDYLGDIYSLGATFYHLVTGFTPFNHNSMEELLRMRLDKDPVAPNLQRPELPDDVSNLILSMMDRDPQKRPSYQEIAKKLSAYLKGSDTTSRKVKKPTPDGSADAASTGSHSPKKMILKKDSGAGTTSSRYIPARRSHSGLIGTLILLAVLCGLLGFAWKEGVLSRYLTFIPAPGGQVQVDMLPDVSLALAMGNPRSAVEFASPTFESDQEALNLRLQSGLQIIFANALQNMPDAFTSADKMAATFESLPETEKNGIKPAHQIAVYFSQKSDTALLSPDVSAASRDYEAGAALSEFLHSLMMKDPAGKVQPLLEKFKKLVLKMPQTSWYQTSFRRRLPYWEQVVSSQSGISTEVEPVFAYLVEKKTAWTFSKTKDLPGSISGLELPDAEFNTGADAAPVKQAPQARTFPITEDLITKAAHGLEEKRPHPLSPAAITKADLQKYLSTLPAAERKPEFARARILLEAKEHLARLMLKMPYEARSFSTINGSLGSGVVMANPNYLSFKNTKGVRTRVKWNQLPVEEFMKIIFFYAQIREHGIQNNPAMKTPDNLEALAWDYLRLAVLAAWYGNNADAAEAAKKALSAYPKLADEIELLMLK